MNEQNKDMDDLLRDAQDKGLITVYKGMRLEGNIKAVMAHLAELAKAMNHYPETKAGRN